ncbi:hypothetical protein GCM10020256_06050 [Streptomyces thermocoprophilus]
MSLHRGHTLRAARHGQRPGRAPGWLASALGAAVGAVPDGVAASPEGDGRELRTRLAARG